MRSARPASAAGPSPTCSGPSSSRLAVRHGTLAFTAGKQGLSKAPLLDAQRREFCIEVEANLTPDHP